MPCPLASTLMHQGQKCSNTGCSLPTCDCFQGQRSWGQQWVVSLKQFHCHTSRFDVCKQARWAEYICTHPKAPERPCTERTTGLCLWLSALVEAVLQLNQISSLLWGTFQLCVSCSSHCSMMLNQTPISRPWGQDLKSRHIFLQINPSSSVNELVKDIWGLVTLLWPGTKSHLGKIGRTMTLDIFTGHQ